MANCLFVTATESRSGKSAVCLGLMEMLSRKIQKIGFFRPIIHRDPEPDQPDNDIVLMSSYFNLDIPYEDMFAFTAQQAKYLQSLGKTDEVIDGVISKFNQLEDRFDFILCEGTDFLASTSHFEFDINAEIAKNLGCPVLLVGNAFDKTLDEALRSTHLALESLKERGCHTMATIINRIRLEEREKAIDELKNVELARDQLIYAIPDKKTLGNPTVGEVARALQAEVLFGENQLNRHVYSFTVAAMQLRNFLTRIEHGTLIITPGDRADVIVASLAALLSSSLPNISGIVLTGGLALEPPIQELIKGFTRMVPILMVKTDTLPTVRIIDQVHSTITPKNHRKITRALAIFDQFVDVQELGEKIITTRTDTMTPKMFEFGLLEKARSKKQHIVLPEGEDDRILAASEMLLRRNVVDLTLLGNPRKIKERISRLGLYLDGVKVINPCESGYLQDFIDTYYQLRRHKGITRDIASDMMNDVSYFGTMMVYRGLADGMVSGAQHTTAATVRPSLEIIKTQKGFSIVSSVFFMCLADRVLVYGDCAVNPNPNSSQLAEIAITSARTARTFGIDPVVAMLSYSTGESGTGEDVDRVREATGIARDRAVREYPGLKIDGPIQYDAAVDMSVARTKMPGSEVAGQATVLIFPDLNTGNNTYKAVQRSSGAVAVGPVLQGLKHPVNDLSRGCTVADIVNTVAITAIQAQAGKAAS